VGACLAGYSYANCTVTRFAGYDICITACCGANYSKRRYASINYSSAEYWTDGYREKSLMPNDRGLRRCQCGNFFLQRELIVVEHVASTDVPSAPMVDPEELPQAIAGARNPSTELAARLDYWQHLNHPYRERYRAHREAEDAATKVAWEAINPDLRNPLQKTLQPGRVPKYTPLADRPVTFPAFEPFAAQRENMMAALDLIPGAADAERYALERVELCRELGQFQEAQRALKAVDSETYPMLHRLTTRLIDIEAPAVVRYHL
jgi:hypothetical protein